MVFRDKHSEDKSIHEDSAENGQEVDSRLVELETELESVKDQVLRRTAEMENMRRRFTQEREQLIFDANKRLILDLLQTVDDSNVRWNMRRAVC